jgi:hypothetical protein
VLLDDVGCAQIVIDSNAGTIDEDVECVNRVRGRLDLQRVCYVQWQGCHARVGVSEAAACACVYQPRPQPDRLIDECLTNASVGTQ